MSQTSSIDCTPPKYTFARFKEGIVAATKFKDFRKYLNLCGKGVQKEHGVNLLKQWTDLVLMAFFYGTTPDHYYRYCLYLRPFEDAPLFITGRTMAARHKFLLRAFNPNRLPLIDKRELWKICHKAGIQVPQMVADFQRGKIHWWNEEQRLPELDLFVKEGCAQGGAGASRWDYLGDRRWRGNKGAELAEAQLVEWLQKQSEKCILVVQERLSNHPEIADLGPKGLCTVRVVTLLDVDKTEVEVLQATFKMPTGTAVVDHFVKGALASVINVETGALGPALDHPVEMSHVKIHQHTTTGGQITGRILPLWKDVLSTAIVAHEQYKTYGSLGWDIAISSRGVILVEGNPGWAAILSQQPGLLPLGDGRCFENFYKSFRKAVPVAKIEPPPGFFAGWATSTARLKDRRPDLFE